MQIMNALAVSAMYQLYPPPWAFPTTMPGIILPLSAIKLSEGLIKHGKANKTSACGANIDQRPGVVMPT